MDFSDLLPLSVLLLLLFSASPRLCVRIAVPSASAFARVGSGIEAIRRIDEVCHRGHPE
jgi:hypothetical protein